MMVVGEGDGREGLGDGWVMLMGGRRSDGRCLGMLFLLFFNKNLY